MPFDFPNAPFTGQTATTPNGVYQWDGAKWVSVPPSPQVVLGAAPPVTPQPGNEWWDTTGGLMYMWYDDGNSQQWVNVNNVNAPSLTAALAGYLPLTGGVLTGATTFSSASSPLAVPSGLATFGAGATGGSIRIQGQAGVTRTLQFTTNNVARWNITGSSDAESGNNAGTQYKIDAYSDAGAFLGNLFQAFRASGPLGTGLPYVRNLAPWRQNATKAADSPGSTIGNDMEFGVTTDYQPQATLGANPLAVTSGSPIVTITWTGACGANGPISVATETWVNLQGATATGGITPTGWLKVVSIVNANTFTVTWTSNATSTTTGGGSAVTVRPSFFTTTNRVVSINKSGANGFINQTTELWAADPDFLQPVGQSIPKYLQRWHWTVGPNDTSGANGWSLTGVEWDLTNRGKDMGYAPNFGANQNGSTGIWIGPKSGIPGWVTGGGVGTNWNTIIGVFADSAGPSIGVYGALNVQPNALVGAAMDAALHGGVGTEIFGAMTTLPGAPFSTTSGTSTITVLTGVGAVAAQVTGNQCWFPNVITIAGVTFGGASYPITVINGQSFSIVGSGTASASTPGGGTGQWIAFAQYVPFAPHQMWGSFKHGLISTNARFESGGIVETQPGNGMLWSDGTGTASINSSASSPGNISIALTPAGTGAITAAGPLYYTATGAITSRSAQDRAADVVYAKDFGAVFDGNSHPLSASFATLAAAQAVYPKATALTNEIDGIAVQAALDFCAARSGSAHEYSYGGTVVVPNGKGLFNTPLIITASNVALRSGGAGFFMRSLISRFVQSAPTHMQWNGAALAAGSPIVYMLTIAPTDGGRRLSGCNVDGILFDGNTRTGISGALIASVVTSKILLAINEVRGMPYPGSVLTAGSQSITVSSSANILQGQAITSASMPSGAYVMSIVDGVTIQSSIQASASNTETMLIGGEGVRVDTVSRLADVNDTQLNDFSFYVNQEQGAQYSYGPCIMVGGSANPGSVAAQSYAHFGNTSLNFFSFVYANTVYSPAMIVNNTDHNIITFMGVAGLGGTPQGLVLNGSLDPNNGSCRYNMFNYVGASVYARGTETGGFTQVSTGNEIRHLDIVNGGSLAVIAVGFNVGASVVANNLNVVNLGIPYNSNQAIVPYAADSTVMGGNGRGAFAVDLQTARAANTQVASGQNSVVAGGTGNTASAQFSTVAGGSGNTASGQYSTVVGGASNFASGVSSIALGGSASADLYAMFALSSGLIASGRRAQAGMQVLRATSAANTTPVRLTADGAAAGTANVVNLSYSDCIYALSVQLAALDASGGNNFYSWHQPLGLLRRNGAVGSTVYTPGTPVVVATGTTTGIAITEAADTANGGYSITFTPPTGNTAIWRVVATVRLTRVDGA